MRLSTVAAAFATASLSLVSFPTFAAPTQVTGHHMRTRTPSRPAGDCRNRHHLGGQHPTGGPEIPGLARAEHKAARPCRVPALFEGTSAGAGYDDPVLPVGHPIVQF